MDTATQAVLRQARIRPFVPANRSGELYHSGDMKIGRAQLGSLLHERLLSSELVDEKDTGVPKVRYHLTDRGRAALAEASK